MTTPITPSAPTTPEVRVCFYPSSGFNRLWAVMALDCDVFIFSDYRQRTDPWQDILQDFQRRRRDVVLIERSDHHVFFTSGGKAAYLFHEDNNLTLERIKKDYGRVHHFVGICDGCCEGGNYECVHNRPFLSRLLQIAAPNMKYSTDHSEPLESRPYGWGAGVPSQPKFMEYVRWSNFPEPERQRKSWPDEHEKVGGNPVFCLQGVLVARNRQPHGKVTKADLEILRFGEGTTELMTLVPFRTLAHRGILAEYRVEGLEAPAEFATHPQALLALERAQAAQRAHDLNTPVATADTWSTLLPMPDLHEVVPMSVRYRESHMHYIRHGYTPNDMSDKWFCYAVDAHTLRIHRSWTGYCIFEVRFRACGCDEWELYEVVVNRDPEQYRHQSDEHVRDWVVKLVANYLLSPRVQWPQFVPLQPTEATGTAPGMR